MTHPTRHSLSRRSIRALVLCAALLLSACGPSDSVGERSPASGGATAPAAQSAPKRMTAAIIGDPPTMYQVLNPAGSRGGSEILQDLAHAGLGIVDRQGSLQPQLATAIPSLDNGMWQLFPDGRMQTSWTIREGAVWHDGAPLTADDLVFTIAVGQDPELPEFRDAAISTIESVEAIDARTVRVTWSKTYISADNLFTRGLAPPLPKHILEPLLLENKATFSQQPYFPDQ